MQNPSFLLSYFNVASPPLLPAPATAPTPPHTTTAHHCCPPLLNHGSKNFSKNYPINRSGMPSTSSFDLWNKKCSLLANLRGQLRLAGAFSKNTGEQERKEEEEEERERCGGVILSDSAACKPKAKFRPPVSRNGGARGASASGRMKVGFYAADRLVSALCWPKGKIRPPESRRCASFAIF